MTASNHSVTLNRLDDSFRLIIVVSSVLMGFLRASGIPPVERFYWKTDLTATLLVVAAMIVWSVGHVRMNAKERTMKLIGWLLWSDITALLLIVAFWGVYARFGWLEMIIWISVPSLVIATAVTWTVVSRIYGRRSLSTLVVGLIIAGITPFIAFGP